MVSAKKDKHDSAPTYLVLKPKWLIVILLTIAFPWIIIGFNHLLTTKSCLPIKPIHKKEIQGKKGAWGVLEYVPIIIAPPMEFVSIKMFNDEKPLWRFPNFSATQFEELINSFEMTIEQRNFFLQNSTPDPEVKGFKVTPEDRIVLSLSNKTRQKLYTYLGQFPANPEQEHAFRFCGNSVHEWFRSSNLPKSDPQIKCPDLQ